MRHLGNIAGEAGRQGGQDARDTGGNQVRLLATLVGPDTTASVVAAQTEIGVKTNEVPMAAVVLVQIDLDNKIVTANVLHTVKAPANQIQERVRAPRQGEPAGPVRRSRRAAVGPGADRPYLS